MIEPGAATVPQAHGLFAVRRSGRFTYRAQWWAPLILAVWIVIGRTAVGSTLGMMAVLGMFTVLPVLALLLYVPAWITLADRDAKHLKKTRFGYDIASYVLWGVLVLWGLFIPDGGDAPPFGSAVTAWTRGAFTVDDSVQIFGTLQIVAAVVYIITVGLSIAGATRPSRFSPPRTAGDRPAVVTVAMWFWWAAIALETVLTAVNIWALAPLGMYEFPTVAGQMGLGIAIIVIGCIFVPRLRAGHLAPRWVLAAVGVIAVGTTVVDGSLTNGRWTFELAPVLLLVAATVLLFLPAATRFFRLPATVSRRGDGPPSELAPEPGPPAAAGIQADAPSPADT